MRARGDELKKSALFSYALLVMDFELDLLVLYHCLSFLVAKIYIHLNRAAAAKED